MTSRNSRRDSFRLAFVAAAGLGLALGLAGCEKKKKPAPPPPPPPAPVHVDPDPVDINGILAELSPDARVKFPESKAPADRELAEAAIRLADAFAKGDASALRGMLSSEARGPLDTLMSEGHWTDETKKIEQVRVVQVDPQYSENVESGTIVLALQVPGGAYPLAWEGRKRGGNWVFKNVAVEDRELRRASDFDTVSLRLGNSFAPEASEVERVGAEEDEGERPAGEEERPTSPDRKQTPGGPITIPKPGGGTPGG